METIRIFDEVNFPEAEITPEQRNQKRTVLEPFVFNILRAKYGAELAAAYLTTPPPHPAINNKCLIIIERRVHPNLEFVLHNCAMFAKEWSLCFVCSHVNLDYCKQIAGPWKNRIAFLPLFQDSPNYTDARNEYNALLKTPTFWKELPWEIVGIVQTDSYFLRPVPTEDLLQYDYIAATAAWDTDNMIGGMSFRRPAAMERVCTEFPEELPGQGEDIYFSHGVIALNLRRPMFPESGFYITESYLTDESFGTHQWWTYMFPKEYPEVEFYFHRLLSLELPPRTAEPHTQSSVLSTDEKALLAKAVQELEEFIKTSNPNPYVVFFPDALKNYTLHQVAIDYMAEKGYHMEDDKRIGISLLVTPDVHPAWRQDLTQK